MSSVGVFIIDNHGESVEQCRLVAGDDGVHSVPDVPIGRYVLSRSLPDGLGPADGERYLKALPGHYSGGRFRVGGYLE